MKTFALAMPAMPLTPALAQDAGDSAKGTGPVATPNAAPATTPICIDRPTKSNVACTVPAGAIQIETDLINWTRPSAGGTRTDTILYANPTVKLGVGTHTDIEANVAPYATVRTRDADGATSTIRGVGDLYLRVKQRLTADDAKTQVSFIPYLKAPTARVGIGANFGLNRLTPDTQVYLGLSTRF